MQPEALCLRYKTRAELREILQYWISSFCGSSDQVDNDSGKHMECKSPPPTHLLPPLVYQDRKLLFILSYAPTIVKKKTAIRLL